MRSDLYCDYTGANCFTASTTAALVNGGGGGGGGSIGVVQQWYDVTASRRIDQVYQNSTGDPIQISAELGSNGVIDVSVDNSDWIRVSGGNGQSNNRNGTLQVIVPNDHYYRAISGNGQGVRLIHWSELRPSPVAVTERSFSGGQATDAINALAGINAERVASRSAERDAVCEALFAGSRSVGHRNQDFYSPGNNNIAWLRNGVWERVGASNYNSQIQSIDCSTN